MSKIEKPEIVTDEHLEYLDDLRDSGVTNMFSAGRYVENAFPVSKEEAGDIIIYWMHTFSDRHPA